MDKDKTPEEEMAEATALLEQSGYKGYTVCPNAIAELARSAPQAQLGIVRSDVKWASADYFQAANNIIFCTERLLEALSSGVMVTNMLNEVKNLRNAYRAYTQLHTRAADNEATE